MYRRDLLVTDTQLKEGREIPGSVDEGMSSHFHLSFVQLVPGTELYMSSYYEPLYELGIG